MNALLRQTSSGYSEKRSASLPRARRAPLRVRARSKPAVVRLVTPTRPLRGPVLTLLPPRAEPDAASAAPVRMLYASVAACVVAALVFLGGFSRSLERKVLLSLLVPSLWIFVAELRRPSVAGATRGALRVTFTRTHHGAA